MTPNLGMIHQRAGLLRELRRFFDSRGFLEVQPPCLSRDCIVDAYIDPIHVATDELRLAVDPPSQFYLQTSPEAAMKRMLAAGAPSIYSIGPAFRSGECGRLHNVEFTMLEWYQVGADITGGIKTLGELAAEILGRDGYDVCTYRDSFQQALGFDPIGAPIRILQDHIERIDRSLLTSMGDNRDSLLDVLFTHYVEPQLGVDRPVIVKNYPLSQAALAREAEDDAECAARFELFARGVELANGYDELRDPEILVERLTTNNRQRIESGRRQIDVESPDVESPLLEAMRAGLPQCAGVALGVDRLLMIRTGTESIDEVIPFTVEKA